MIRLQRYLIGELLAQFLLLLMIVTGVFVTGTLLQAVHRYSEIGILAVIQLLPYFLPEAASATVPLAFLMACLLTYGRFSDENEFLALRMGGIHPWHAVAPAVLLGVVISFGTLYLGTEVAPLAELARKEIVKDQLARMARHLEDPRSTRLPVGKKFMMSWNGRDERGWYEDVLITVKDGSGQFGGDGVERNHVIWARNGRIDVDPAAGQLRLDLAGVELEQSGAAGDRTWVSFESLSTKFDLERLVGLPPRLDSKSRDQMRSTELRYRIQRGSPVVEVLRKFQTDYWWRFALGISPAVFGLLGAAMGLVTARGSRGAALLTAFIIAMPVYYPLLLLGKNLSRGGDLEPWVALNLGNFLLLGIAAVLVRRLVRG